MRQQSTAAEAPRLEQACDDPPATTDGPENARGVRQRRRADRQRLFFVNGPWQAIVALSALLTARGSLEATRDLENRLVIVGARYRPETLAVLEQIFRRVLGPVATLTLRIEDARWRRLLSGYRSRRIRSSLDSAGLLDAVAEVWAIDFSYGLVLSAYGETPRYLFEDGIISYVHYNGYATGGARSAMTRSALGHYVCRPDLMCSPAPNLRRISAEAMREIIALVRGPSLTAARQAPGSVSREKTALLLGQGLHRSLRLARSDELSVYAEACARLTKQGYRVLWKDHPRDHRPFYDELRERFGDAVIETRREAQFWPVETLLDGLALDLCVGATCSTLIYGQYLFGLPARTIAAQMASCRFTGIRGRWRRRIFAGERRIAEAVCGNLDAILD